jgi:hypothetical protein
MSAIGSGPHSGARFSRGARRNLLDAKRFDDMVKQVATTRLTRLSALRGLAAAGIAALTGVRFAAEQGDAKKSGGKRRKVCHCGNSPTNCQTKKKSKRAVKRHLRKHACDHKGSCQSTNPRCPAPTSIPSSASNPQCQVGGTACPGGLTCVAIATGSTSGICLQVSATCVPGSQSTCAAGETCITIGAVNVCAPVSFGGGPGAPCTTGANCLTGFCSGGTCALCPALQICGPVGSEVCCAVGTTCAGGTTCLVSL